MASFGMSYRSAAGASAIKTLPSAPAVLMKSHLKIEGRNRAHSVSFALATAPSELPEELGPYRKLLQQGKETEDDYEIGILLDSGSDSQGVKVYRAVNQKTGEPRALKLLEVDRKNPHALQQAFNEVAVLQKLGSHPHIAKFYGSYFAVETNELWLVLEVITGGSAASFCPAVGRPLREQECAAILAAVASGLDHAHKNGVIHRNVRGSCVLLSVAGAVKLAGFGNAFQTQAPVPASAAAQGVVVQSDGSFSNHLLDSAQFLAPELAAHSGFTGSGRKPAAPYTDRVDVWSLGVMALELVHGKGPLDDMELDEAMARVADESWVPSLSADEWWSKDFKQFLSLCLVRDPTKRASIAEIMKCKYIAGVTDRWGIDCIKAAAVELARATGQVMDAEEKETKMAKLEKRLGRRPPSAILGISSAE